MRELVIVKPASELRLVQVTGNFLVCHSLEAHLQEIHLLLLSFLPVSLGGHFFFFSFGGARKPHGGGGKLPLLLSMPFHRRQQILYVPFRRCLVKLKQIIEPGGRREGGISLWQQRSQEKNS